MGAHELKEELIAYTQTVWGWRISHVVVSFLLVFMLMRVLREGEPSQTLCQVEPTALLPGAATIFLLPLKNRGESRGLPWWRGALQGSGHVDEFTFPPAPASPDQ